MMDRFRQEGSVCACPPVSYQTCGPHANIMPPQGFYSDDRKYTEGIPLSNYYNTAIGTPMPSRMNSTSTLPSASGSPKRSNTLENVLLGKVPPAYSHLASHRRSPYSQGRHENHSPTNAQAHVSSILDIPVPVSKRSSPFSQHSVQSPRRVIPQTYSPPINSSPFQNGPHEDVTFPPQTVYMRSPVPAPSSSPLWSQQCSPHQIVTSSQIPSSSSPSSSCSSEICQDEPIDLSCKAASPAPPRSDSTGSCDMSSSSSMLRNLLSRGKHENVAQFGNFRDLSDSLEQIPPIRNVNGSTRVTLAKKNMYPVGSRVSDWLVKIIQFSKSIPDFANLSHNDKVSLILNAWTRILLLYMAESNFQFAVTPLRTEVTSDDEKAAPSPDQPTMKSVDTIQNFIRKCQTMNLDQKEYAFLRMAVLFNAGYSGLDRPEHVDQLNSLIQQLLKEHVQTSRPNDVMHYSRLLLCLPALYGINCKMIENLFCKHINGNMDIEMLLKEMLQNL